MSVCKGKFTVLYKREAISLPLLFLCRLWYYLTFRRAQHIFDENSIPLGWICYHYMSYRSHELAVLSDRTARHECVQVGTTIFRILYDIDQ